MKLSIVTTLYQSAPYIEEFHRRASAQAQLLAGDDYEIVMVNDGSPDDSLERAVALHELDPHVVVVDPPRKGLDSSVIRAIAEAGPSRVVYVSCNVATLARDAALFLEAGYRTEKVQPVDMFCWTSGIETVCLLSKFK